MNKFNHIILYAYFIFSSLSSKRLKVYEKKMHFLQATVLCILLAVSSYARVSIDAVSFHRHCSELLLSKSHPSFINFCENDSCFNTLPTPLYLSHQQINVLEASLKQMPTVNVDKRDIVANACLVVSAFYVYSTVAPTLWTMVSFTKNAVKIVSYGVKTLQKNKQKSEDIDDWEMMK